MPTAARPVADVLLTARQAADALGISQRTLREWTAPRGTVPVVRLGRLVRYRPDALAEWAAARETRPRPAR